MLHWPNRKFTTLLEVMVAVLYLLEAVISSYMALLRVRGFLLSVAWL